MDRIGLLQLAPVVLVGAALRKIVGVLAVELGELLQRVVPVMEAVAGNFLEQPPPDDLVALLLDGRPPRGFDARKGLLEPRQRLLTAFAADLDLRCGQRGDQQRAGARLDRLGQRLHEGQVRVERAGRQPIDLVDLAQIGDPLVDQDQAGRALLEDRLEHVRAGRDALGVVLGDHVERFGAAKLPGEFAPGRADLRARLPRSERPADRATCRPAPRG